MAKPVSLRTCHFSTKDSGLMPREHELLQLCLTVFPIYSEPDLNEPTQAGNSLRTFDTAWRPLVSLLDSLSESIRECKGNYDLTIKRLDDLILIAKEKFYAFPFTDVPGCWRALFRKASLLKVTAILVRGAWGRLDELESLSNSTLLETQQIDEIVNVMDMALIMAGPPQSQPGSINGRHAVQEMFRLLGEIHSQSIEKEWDGNQLTKRRKLDLENGSWSDHFPTSSVHITPISCPIPKQSQPTYEAFEHHIQNPRFQDLGPEPVIINGSMDSWPAWHEHPWKSPSYLLSKTIGGRRLVPIELGRSYVDDGWGQSIIPFKEFMNDYIISSETASGTGYLAQHDLFAQIPDLRGDIAVPDYCYVSPPPPHHSSPLRQKHAALPHLDEPLLNAWFGPGGTISPLHTDPYHNILAQVVGKKYIRLYAPNESKNLYARGVEHGGVDMGNTSSLDIGILAGWDGTEEEIKAANQEFPLWKDAIYMDCVLEEGDFLYIPVGWWHYVRSLSVSFSVSFWFN